MGNNKVTLLQLISPVCCVDVHGNYFTAASSCDVAVNLISCIMFGAYDEELLRNIAVNW